MSLFINIWENKKNSRENNAPILSLTVEKGYTFVPDVSSLKKSALNYMGYPPVTQSTFPEMKYFEFEWKIPFLLSLKKRAEELENSPDVSQETLKKEMKTLEIFQNYKVLKKVLDESIAPKKIPENKDTTETLALRINYMSCLFGFFSIYMSTDEEQSDNLLKSFFDNKGQLHLIECSRILSTAFGFLFSKSFSEDLEEFQEDSQDNFNGFNLSSLQGFISENLSKLLTSSLEEPFMDSINVFFANFRDKLSKGAISFERLSYVLISLIKEFVSQASDVKPMLLSLMLASIDSLYNLYDVQGEKLETLFESINENFLKDKIVSKILENRLPHVVDALISLLWTDSSNEDNQEKSANQTIDKELFLNSIRREFLDFKSLVFKDYTPETFTFNYKGDIYCLDSNTLIQSISPKLNQSKASDALISSLEESFQGTALSVSKDALKNVKSYLKELSDKFKERNEFSLNFEFTVKNIIESFPKNKDFYRFLWTKKGFYNGGYSKTGEPSENSRILETLLEHYHSLNDESKVDKVLTLHFILMLCMNSVFLKQGSAEALACVLLATQISLILRNESKESQEINNFQSFLIPEISWYFFKQLKDVTKENVLTFIEDFKNSDIFKNKLSKDVQEQSLRDFFAPELSDIDNNQTYLSLLENFSYFDTYSRITFRQISTKDLEKLLTPDEFTSYFGSSQESLRGNMTRCVDLVLDQYHKFLDVLDEEKFIIDYKKEEIESSFLKLIILICAWSKIETPLLDFSSEASSPVPGLELQALKRDPIVILVTQALYKLGFSSENSKETREVIKDINCDHIIFILRIIPSLKQVLGLFFKSLGDDNIEKSKDDYIVFESISRAFLKTL